jgi:hypothetical protein
VRKNFFTGLTPFLLILTIVIIYAQYSGVYQLNEITRALLFLMAITGIIFFFLFKITHNLYTSSSLISVLISGILAPSWLFYGLAGATAILGVLEVLRVRLLKMKLRIPVFSYFGFLTLIFLVFFGSNYLAKILNTPYKEVQNIQFIKTGLQTATIPPSSPDIYYIILDGYGREDILREYYQYDNSEFIAALQKRGFYVASESYSNYMRTQLSINSSLNMSYLDDVSKVLASSGRWRPQYELIYHNEVRKFLESQGYISVALDSDFDASNIHDVDLYLTPYRYPLPDFERMVISSSALRYIATILPAEFQIRSFDTHRYLANFALQELENILETTKPKFVFAHIILPHPPFVFDSTGRSITPSYIYRLGDASDFPLSNDEYRRGYTEQMTYLNQRILQVIDQITARSANPPVIIIQGDHGPGMFTDFLDLDKTCLNERFSILNAYLLPDKDLSQLHPDISPVNSFRIVLNEYFGTDLEFLPNRSYYITESSKYDFIDVTDKVSNVCSQIP